MNITVYVHDLECSATLLKEHGEYEFSNFVVLAPDDTDITSMLYGCKLMTLIEETLIGEYKNPGEYTYQDED